MKTVVYEVEQARQDLLDDLLGKLGTEESLMDEYTELFVGMPVNIALPDGTYWNGVVAGVEYAADCTTWVISNDHDRFHLIQSYQH